MPQERSIARSVRIAAITFVVPAVLIILMWVILDISWAYFVIPMLILIGATCVAYVLARRGT